MNSGGKNFYIWGVRIDGHTKQEALEEVERLIADGGSHYIVTPNPEILLHARANPSFRSVLNGAALSLCDGIGLYLALRTKGICMPERICGADFIEDICRAAEKKGWSICCIGAHNAVRARSMRVLRDHYPDLIVQDGGEGAGDLPPCDIAFAALGAPKQEFWMSEQIARGSSAKIMMGVGGAFDMISGVLPRAPRIMRKAGLEWLWRLILEPRRWRRIFRAVFIFPLLCILDTKKNL